MRGGLALERSGLNARSEPSDVLGVIWDPQLDSLRCNDAFRRVVHELMLADRRRPPLCPLLQHRICYVFAITMC